MNIKRFKKILAVYIVAFVLLGLFLPYNVYFYGDQMSKVDPTKVYKADIYIDRGLRYKFAGQGQYDNQIALNINNLRYIGYLDYRPNYLLIISEFAVITMLFAGVSYITCKKE
jgi:hypothetical protein